ncbi:MAG: hypothetical protein WD512_13370 [Candidatus Paceibacterota bacterium]
MGLRLLSSYGVQIPKKSGSKIRQEIAIGRIKFYNISKIIKNRLVQEKIGYYVWKNNLIRLHKEYQGMYIVNDNYNDNQSIIYTELRVNSIFKDGPYTRINYRPLEGGILPKCFQKICRYDKFKITASDTGCYLENNKEGELPMNYQYSGQYLKKEINID